MLALVAELLILTGIFMDIVSELTARATAYLLVLQDAWALPPGPTPEVGSPLAALCERVFATPCLASKARALAGSTMCLDKTPPPATKAAQDAAFEHAAGCLLAFVHTHLTADLLREVLISGLAGKDSFLTSTPLLKLWQATLRGIDTLMPTYAGPVPPARALRYLTPEQWRRMLRVVLYLKPAARVELAKELNYLPTLVYSLLNRPGKTPVTTPKTWEYYMQLPDCELAQELNRVGCPVPFEVVFDQELLEITTRRAGAGLPAPQGDDPLLQADKLQLCALAFSGGGIRSATFNLGLLQGLAGAGWLRHFDYLSTVSGGGYVGSWLAAWIKREGSLQKVADRLAPTKSPTPNAEEVRPLRWLRMYSNYLNPNAGLFSTDTWTLGITWLRNMLLNQCIIVLALGSALAAVSAVLHAWMWPQHDYRLLYTLPWWWIPFITGVFLTPGVVLASKGMQAFDRSPAQPRDPGVISQPTGKMLLWALAGALLASWFFYHHMFPGVWESTKLLWPVAVITTGALVIVARYGHYERSFYRRHEAHVLSGQESMQAWAFIGLASALAAAAGLGGLVGVWYLLGRLQDVWPGDPSLIWQVLLYYGSFMAGPPLVLEVVALTVIVRMALLGANFPDERREWWGRLGAELHMLMLGWAAITGSVLLVRVAAHLLATSAHPSLGLVFSGGWLALVGKAVQLAFNARTSAQPVPQPGKSNWLDHAMGLAPYLFGLGLMMLTSGALHWLLVDWPSQLRDTFRSLPASNLLVAAYSERTLMLRALLWFPVLGLLAAVLGWRVGVNEFSLHHFYRNRLVRAYLGASRLRFEREHTANPYTGFDRHDDVKLCSLQHEDPLLQPVPHYDGPYMLINATLNASKVTDLAQQSRQAESFVFSPLYCGFDFARVRAVNPTKPTFEFGYRPTRDYAYGNDNGPGLGTAMAISGAAANPNEGYHSSPATAFLLTLFNVRLGWWMGNPSGKMWRVADPQLGLLYLLKDLFGTSDTSNAFVNLSDGGHFDNMGLYELVRRRCRYIVLGDGEEDHFFTCEGLANAIRRCRVDFGVEIAIDVTPITNRIGGYSQRHYAVGTIQYSDDAPGLPSGYLLYLKTSLTGDEPTDVREYAQYNSAFPHQSTGDQFFNEAQFESYRRLGLHIFEALTANCPAIRKPGQDLGSIFQQLAASPSGPSGLVDGKLPRTIRQPRQSVFTRRGHRN